MKRAWALWSANGLLRLLVEVTASTNFCSDNIPTSPDSMDTAAIPGEAQSFQVLRTCTLRGGAIVLLKRDSFGRQVWRRMCRKLDVLLGQGPSHALRVHR
jgi:hypothetical protein